MNNKSSIIPEINPYLCGIKCSKEGTKIWKDRFISGECSYEKRLNPEFINYDKQWLLDFLAGLIDSDGYKNTEQGKMLIEQTRNETIRKLINYINEKKELK